MRSRAPKGRLKGRFGPRKGNTCHSHLAFFGYCLYTSAQLCPTLPLLFSYIFSLFSYDFLCFSFMLRLSFMLLPYCFFTLFLYEAFLMYGFLLDLVGGDGWCGFGPRKADSGPETGTRAPFPLRNFFNTWFHMVSF